MMYEASLLPQSPNEMEHTYAERQHIEENNKQPVTMKPCNGCVVCCMCVTINNRGAAHHQMTVRRAAAHLWSCRVWIQLIVVCDETECFVCVRVRCFVTDRNAMGSMQQCSMWINKEQRDFVWQSFWRITRKWSSWLVLDSVETINCAPSSKCVESIYGCFVRWSIIHNSKKIHTPHCVYIFSCCFYWIII